MKRFSLIIVSAMLAVGILFGSLIGQMSTAQAASISNHATPSKALISTVERHVHVINHHATIDAQLSFLVTKEQLQIAQLAVNTYNELSASAIQTFPALAQHVSKSSHVSHMIGSKVYPSKAHPMYWVACMYISNGTMDTIAWTIIFGGGILSIAGIIVALFTAGWGAAIAIAGVIVGIGGAYLLWYSDKYWGNGTTWCVDSYYDVWYYVD